MSGRSPSGPGSRPSDGAASSTAAPPEASIPNAAFTPGPWHVFASSYAASHHNSVEINDRGGLTVAWAQKFIPPHVEQSDANARLLAAAPELFEALELADATLRGANMNRAVVERKVSAALAKARGEA